MDRQLPFSCIYTPQKRFLINAEDIGTLAVEGVDSNGRVQTRPKKYTPQYRATRGDVEVALYSIKKGNIGIVFLLKKRGKSLEINTFTHKEFRAARILRGTDLRHFAGAPPIVLSS